MRLFEECDGRVRLLCGFSFSVRSREKISPRVRLKVSSGKKMLKKRIGGNGDSAPGRSAQSEEKKQRKRKGKSLQGQMMISVLLQSPL